jgi:hypothetical protein
MICRNVRRCLNGLAVTEDCCFAIYAVIWMCILDMWMSDVYRWELIVHSASQGISPFMEPEGSLLCSQEPTTEPEGSSLCSQEPTTDPYFEPYECSAQPSICYSKIHFNIIVSSVLRSFKWCLPVKLSS